MSLHSEKALKTLAMMNTKPAEWGLTEIIWKEEIRRVPVEVPCPTCRGNRRTYLVGDRLPTKEELRIFHGQWGDKTIPKKFRNMFQHQRGELLGFDYGWCLTCRSSREHYGVRRGLGFITVMKDQKVRVGYVQWAKKTQFDSRFSGQYRVDASYICELCSKTIKDIWHGLVPVTAKGVDGVIHGMWIGRDCGRKFFGVKKNFKKDEFIEVPHAKK